MIDSVPDVWRVVNIVLCVACLGGMWAHRKVWSGIPAGWYIGISVVMFVVVAIAAAVESLLHHEPLAWRTPMTSVASGWLLMGLLYVRRSVKRHEARVRAGGPAWPH